MKRWSCASNGLVQGGNLSATVSLGFVFFGDVLLYYWYHGKSLLHHHLGNISGTFSKHRTSNSKFQPQIF